VLLPLLLLLQVNANDIYLVVNAGCRDKDLEHIGKHLSAAKVRPDAQQTTVVAGLVTAQLEHQQQRQRSRMPLSHFSGRASSVDSYSSLHRHVHGVIPCSCSCSDTAQAEHQQQRQQ
jgi:hypothetical protein